MKIFIHAHFYVPKTLAGAEKYLHEIAKYLHAHGHEVIVAQDEDMEYGIDGINVIYNQRNITSYYLWADAIITHLNHAGTAIALGKQFGKPVFHILHNNDPYYELFNAPENNFIIYNSNALEQELKLSLPSIVAHPPLDHAFWANDRDHYFNEYITLVNCCREKGGFFLQHLADALPGYRFMGVKGSYNDQIIQNSQHRNIQFMPVQEDMRKVYDQTRIVIMPSLYESWGMVASEAMASGIPVICTHTAGLAENCGNAAFYVEGQFVGAYRNFIEALNDKKIYDSMVEYGKKRNKTNDLDKILKFMEKQGKGEKDEVRSMKGEVRSTKLEVQSTKDEPEEIKEKEEVEPAKEKKIIEKPGRKRKQPI